MCTSLFDHNCNMYAHYFPLLSTCGKRSYYGFWSRTITVIQCIHALFVWVPFLKYISIPWQPYMLMFDLTLTVGHLGRPSCASSLKYCEKEAFLKPLHTLLYLYCPTQRKSQKCNNMPKHQGQYFWFSLPLLLGHASVSTSDVQFANKSFFLNNSF